MGTYLSQLEATSK